MCGRVAQTKNPTEYGSMLKVDWTELSWFPALCRISEHGRPKLRNRHLREN
jgi:hypothetical protein